ncbi:LapD/MoxY N-terminal periplasmic domain-containing protein [Paracoccus sp. KR1-242]|uniref:LapD/MoxY N-terminal periplasmic domain-containing protein n=1 Tax=Paracoccus sp. KR1-242 TaxID=3410028 RepID=UPI003C01B0CF
MDATGQIGAIGRTRGMLGRRQLRLATIAFAGSTLAWIAMFAITVSVVIWNARDSVRNETESAFVLAKAAATVSLPTSFGHKDILAEATRIATELRSQRHVTAELRDPTGKPIDLPPRAAPDHPAPEWLARLLRPQPLRDVFPIVQYPNMLGVLEIRTEPQDEIAEVWRDLRVLVPLLMVTALAAIGVTLAVTGLVQRRLGQLGAALDRMRDGELDQRAPQTGLAEVNALADGVNALAAHLALERAENRHLQARMMTLAENERARIASDLHDEIGPQLFALQAAVGQATRAEADPALAETLAAVARHSDAIRRGVRGAIDDLRLTPTEGVSLPDMIQELLIEFEDMAGDTTFALDADAAPCEPDEAGQIAVYRFVRESVLNALRHARPGHVEVSLTVEGDHLLARVCDDGTGPPAQGRTGLGQAGMRDRAAALGARWTPPTRLDGRTCTEFRIPCP